VKSFIDGGFQTAMTILTENREALERLAVALLEFETIDGHEVEMLVNGAEVSEVRKLRSNKGDGSGLAAVVTEGAGKKSTGGTDPVGNPGPVTT
jgi:cell division protease FtsH